MNEELWKSILEFDFDYPISDYDFSLRLAKENVWTEAFTNQAILEYKKFMYLAATSELMVSPSEIVDTVWHQHLIFTISYQAFCEILGKEIQHIPSTHNKADFEKFKSAKQRTAKLYNETFGEQPSEIWLTNDMFGTLNLPKPKNKTSTYLIGSILVFLLLNVPAFYLLKPIYSTINPLDFIGFLILLILFTFIVLGIYNSTVIDAIPKRFSKQSFIYNLQPSELIYLKTKRVEHIIHDAVNKLLNNKIIRINDDKTLNIERLNNSSSKRDCQVLSVIKEEENPIYQNVLRKLVLKPVFNNTSNVMDALIRYISKSKHFTKVYLVNIVVLSIILLVISTKITVGFSRDKPVFVISIILLIFLFICVYWLYYISNNSINNCIVGLYKNEILSRFRNNGDAYNGLEWIYFLDGTQTINPSFKPIVTDVSSNYTGSSSGSFDCSTGSDCGSSCGGCGGD